MRRFLSLIPFLLLVFAVGCNDQMVSSEDTEARQEAAEFDQVSDAILNGDLSAAKKQRGRYYTAPLSGDQETPPVETDASGTAIFRIRTGQHEMDYKIAVSDLEDIVAAHIHCAAEGVAGPVGVTLFSGGPVTPGKVLVRDVFTGPNAGNSCGWTKLKDVVDAMGSGNAYVNVHTLAHPGGEIRGQIAEVK